MAAATGCKYIDDYIRAIRSGERPASRELHQAVDLVERKLLEPGVVINGGKTQRARELIERYFEMTLMDWELFVLALVHCYYPDDTLVFTEFLIMMGRGNGKNGFISGLAAVYPGMRGGVMANFSVNGLDGLMLDLAEAAELPDAVAEEMLLAEAEIVAEAQVCTGMKMGVHRTGVTLSSIGHGKMKRTKDGGRVMYVNPRGRNENGDDNALIAFLNEYGVSSRGIAARPFIRTANEAAAEEAADAAAKIYDNYLKSKNL